MSVNQAQLSCEQCQRRKVRCNKSVPCSACIDGGIDCTPVQRQRLPRGRTATKRFQRPADLGSRLQRLETAIAQLQRAQDSDETVEHESLDIRSAASNVGLAASHHSISTKLVASSFWTNLTDAVDGIRDVLVDSEDEGDQSGFTTNDFNTIQQAPGLILFSHQSPRSAMLDRSIIPGSLEVQLLSLYGERFDPLFKALSWPTILPSLMNKVDYCPDLNTPADLDVIRAAVLFAGAVTSLSYELATDKQQVVVHLRTVLEIRLAEANILTTSSFKVLQAFVIYLAALRATRANAQQWTLLPVAIRIASSLGIPSSLNAAFQDQTRVKLWYCIGMLDLQSSFDRGSQPLLCAQDFPIPPADINGSDPALIDLTPSSVERRFTSMTTSLLTYQAMLCQRKLIESTSIAASSNQDQSTWWEKQTRILQAFEQYVANISIVCGGGTTTVLSLQSFTMAIANESMLSMRLLLYRPLQKLPARLRPPQSNFDILQVAVGLLENASFKARPEFVRWSWYSWVKWYALAIVLAELCRATQPWQGAALQAWNTAVSSYDKYAQLVADTEKGLLWQPIARLMEKARKIWTSQTHVILSNDQVAPMHEQFQCTHLDVGSGPKTSVTQVPFTSDSFDEMEWMQWDAFVDDIMVPNVLDEASYWIKNTDAGMVP